MAKKPADLTAIKPFKKKNREALRVIVETPKGSRHKYAFDPKHGVFVLKKVLPAGMYFPYDFGFVPRTEGGDGDPMDVLILMEEPAFPGCMVECRLIGVIEGEQTERSGEKVRNDRLLAVESSNHIYSEIHDVKDLPKHLVEAVGEFFVNYNRLDGKKYRVLNVGGTEVARRRMNRAKAA